MEPMDPRMRKALRRVRRQMWWDMLPDRLRRVLICSWRGHKPKTKMHDYLCDRCSISWPR